MTTSTHDNPTNGGAQPRRSVERLVRLWIARKPNGTPLLHTLAKSEAKCWDNLFLRWRKHLPGLPGIMGMVTKREAKRAGVTIGRCALHLPNAEAHSLPPKCGPTGETDNGKY